MSLAEKATELAEKWGASLTKGAKDGDFSAFEELFVKDEPVYVVLQDSQGNEIECIVEDDGDENSFTWKEPIDLFKKDTSADVNHFKTESDCLGVLGDRMIVESCRFNKDGKIYLAAFSILTLNEDGKVKEHEAFSEPQAENLMAASSAKLAQL